MSPGVSYVLFVFALLPLGAAIGFVSHFARAHLRMFPEKVIDEDSLSADLLNEMMTNKPYLFEKKVVGAKWDDNGYWDDLSNRNLIYYMLSGVAAPLFAGVAFWNEHVVIVDATCKILASGHLNSPLC